MILTVHILTGAAIISRTTNPILGFLFAFFSHYFLDSLPHQEYSIDNILKKEWKQTKKEFLKVFLDIFAGFLIVAIVLFLKNKGEMDIWRFYFQNLPMFLGGFLGILADGLTFLYLLLPKSKFLETLQNFHRKVHLFQNNSWIKIISPPLENIESNNNCNFSNYLPRQFVVSLPNQLMVRLSNYFYVFMYAICEQWAFLIFYF